MLSALWLIQRKLSRRSAGPRTQEPIRVVAKQGVGAKAQIVVVDIEGARYVLGVTEAGVSVVDRLPLPTPGQSAPAPAEAAGTDPTGTELSPPVSLPLRRTLNRGSAASTPPARAFGRPTTPARGAAEVLRRALGA
ncbi:FliO/MopB family protein [Microbacterium pullorum]|uniref:FliO/MopB family protein n=1 Tax=Microbacterium pullorum TaxID=2762236 RepID=UPI00296AED33|nr:flagellar biosynthetic protein FliO [Microbacterium pullorum]